MEDEKETKTQKARRTLKAPPTLGACVDKLYTLRTTRLGHEHAAADLQAEYTALEEHVIKRYKKQGLDGARGHDAQCSVNVKTVGRVEDRDKLQAFVKKTGAWELLTYQVNNKAYRERLGEKKTVPGVVPLDVTKLSVTAARGGGEKRVVAPKRKK